jgi:hypothetical protein
LKGSLFASNNDSWLRKVFALGDAALYQIAAGGVTRKVCEGKERDRKKEFCAVYAK